jgi:hypothetical protein
MRLSYMLVKLAFPMSVRLLPRPVAFADKRRSVTRGRNVRAGRVEAIASRSRFARQSMPTDREHRYSARIPIHLDIKILFLGSNLDDGEGSADTLDRAAVSVLIDGSVARAVLVQGNGIAFCPMALLQLAHIERQNLLCFIHCPFPSTCQR